ncbi:MAG: hypothetical protein ACTHK7_01900 [Aureliella sp.]
MGRIARNAITGEPQAIVKTVVVIPLTCPNCGSDERTKLEDYTAVSDTEITVDGITYTKVTWARTSCKECGTRYVVKRFGFSNSSQRELSRPSQLIPNLPDANFGHGKEIAVGT